MAQRVFSSHYIAGGKAPGEAYRTIVPMSADPRRPQLELAVVASFCETWLAKYGHNGPIGMNLLEKIQLPNLPTLYGAMLAGIDYILMGAGIPWEIPGILDQLAQHNDTSMKLHVEGSKPDEDFRMHFRPRELCPDLPPLKRPKFLAIIASATLAPAILKRAVGSVEGWIIEGPKAGGHNAPPRGQLKLSESGEPIYGPRDEVDLEKIRTFGLPYWLAGTFGHPERIREALALGAVGVQVGTAFALTRESGLAPELKERILAEVREKRMRVFTDPKASPTGFPFKVARLDGTMSEIDIYGERNRVCDLGYLREMYRREDGQIGYRCPSEPLKHFLRKGGTEEAAEGRKCLCNGLLANIGMPQQRSDGYVEQPLVTIGDDVVTVDQFLKPGADSYSAADVLDYLLQGVVAPAR